MSISKADLFVFFTESFRIISVERSHTLHQRRGFSVPRTNNLTKFALRGIEIIDLKETNPSLNSKNTAGKNWLSLAACVDTGHFNSPFCVYY